MINYKKTTVQEAQRYNKTVSKQKAPNILNIPNESLNTLNWTPFKKPVPCKKQTNKKPNINK